MKILIIVLTLLSTIFAKELIYVPVPLFNEHQTLEENKPLIDYLSKKLNVEIKIRYIQDYEEILSEFKAQKIDFIQIGALPYMTLKALSNELKPILFFKEKSGNDRYRCAIISAFDGANSINEINSKMALTQGLSTCGYFSASYLLKKNGVDIEKIGYKNFNSHEDVIKEVILGHFKTGSIKSSIAKSYSNMSIKILKESDEFPSFALAINSKKIDETLQKKVVDILMQVDKNVSKEFIAGKYGFSIADEEAYNTLKKINHDK